MLRHNWEAGTSVASPESSSSDWTGIEVIESCLSWELLEPGASLSEIASARALYRRIDRSSSRLSPPLLLALGNLLLESSFEGKGSASAVLDTLLEADVGCDCMLFKTESKSAFALDVDSGEGGVWPFSATVVWN